MCSSDLHLQQLIDQATSEADIHYIMVIDASRRIIAASDHKAVGARAAIDISGLLPSAMGLEKIDIMQDRKSVV